MDPVVNSFKIHYEKEKVTEGQAEVGHAFRWG